MTMRRRVVLSLGSNLGDSLDTLQRAVTALAEILHVVAVSGVYATEPVGLRDQPDFLNIVVLADTAMSSLSVLDQAQAIEAAHGRVRAGRWGPRTLDIDLILVGDETRQDNRLVLPHPRVHERAFVLVPWLEVEPAAVIPGYGRVDAVLSGLDLTGVRLLDDVTIEL
ncbi:MAG: 2-amino-4-hydroxy-6-hydroxymethyldihydropteridine diphosphokinase [Propioniciclava sp.]